MLVQCSSETCLALLGKYSNRFWTIHTCILYLYNYNITSLLSHVAPGQRLFFSGTFVPPALLKSTALSKSSQEKLATFTPAVAVAINPYHESGRSHPEMNYCLALQYITVHATLSSTLAKHLTALSLLGGSSRAALRSY